MWVVVLVGTEKCLQVSESSPNNVLKWLSKSSAVKVSDCEGFGLNFLFNSFQIFVFLVVFSLYQKCFYLLLS